MTECENLEYTSSEERANILRKICLIFGLLLVLRASEYQVQLHIFAFQSHISADKVLLSTCCIAEIINDDQSKWKTNAHMHEVAWKKAILIVITNYYCYYCFSPACFSPITFIFSGVWSDWKVRASLLRCPFQQPRRHFGERSGDRPQSLLCSPPRPIRSRDHTLHLQHWQTENVSIIWLGFLWFCPFCLCRSWSFCSFLSLSLFISFVIGDFCVFIFFSICLGNGSKWRVWF